MYLPLCRLQQGSLSVRATPIFSSLFWCCSGASHLDNCVFGCRFGPCLLSFIRGLLRCCPAAAALIHKDCSRYAVSVCRQLLADGSWRRAGLVARAVALVETAGLSGMLAEGTKGQTAGVKQKKHSKKGTKGKERPKRPSSCPTVHVHPRQQQKALFS